MYARVVLGATKSVPFREVSSIQGCPYRGVPLYLHIENERSGAFRLDATVKYIGVVEKCDFQTNRSIFGLCSKSTKRKDRAHL